MKGREAAAVGVCGLFTVQVMINITLGTLARAGPECLSLGRETELQQKQCR